jgi:virulence-associated protein VapD
MARAASLANKDKRQQGNVSFALTILQRRLASSPLAIFNSLQRRLARLEAVAEGGATTSQFNLANSVDLDLRDDVGGDLPDDELEDIQEGEAVDGASASTTTAELLQETASLKNLVVLAKAVLDSEMDTKWLELKGILQSEHMLNGKDGEFEKLIIFTEHRDTLEYLRRRVTETLGKNYKVITIHGGHSRDERRRSQTEFTHNPIAPILIGTDAAGEGINLQRAHFMVNYDLPWNPNRIEQRFGRIHRIGQASECTLWNLVSSNTREGSVYKRLLEKITTQGQAYNGNLFHILGGEELFEGRSLSDLLLDAIANEGHDSNKVLDAGFAKADAELQAASALVPEVVSSFDSSEIARRMNEAKSRRLAPGFVAGFFQEAFKDLGGVLQTKEPERYKIANVPSSLSKLSRQDQSIGDLSSQYERVTFRPENVELAGAPDAELVAPGAPLMNAVVRAILDKHGFNLAQGAIFLDENTVESDDSRLLVCLTQELVNNFDQTKPIERLVTFVEVSKSGDVQFHDTPPFFDLLLPEKNELEDLARLALAALDLPQLMEAGKTALSQRTISKRLPDLKREVGEQLDRTLVEVRKRMDQEVKYWKNEAKAISQGTRSNSDWSAAQAANKANELLGRRDARMDQIGREKMILAKPVQVVSVALVVPSSLAKGSDPAPVMTPREQEAIIRVERRAVDFVLRVESALGADPIEMPRNNKGFDISTLREETGRTFIEVKGRAVDATDFIITESEFSFGHTQGQSFILALVSVAHGDDAAQDEVRYIVDPFKGQAPIWGAHAHVLRFKDYWEKGFDPNF